jgi:uncharacterized protein
MHRALLNGYNALRDKSGVDPAELEFRGFDGTCETRQMAYCWFFCEDPSGRMFTELPRGDNFNSHCPMLPRYVAMLQEWRVSSDPNNLTKADIVRVAAAARSIKIAPGHRP